jgi:hypothetical protein
LQGVGTTGDKFGRRSGLWGRVGAEEERPRWGECGLIFEQFVSSYFSLPQGYLVVTHIFASRGHEPG